MDKALLKGALVFKIKHHEKCAARCSRAMAADAHRDTITRLEDLLQLVENETPIMGFAKGDNKL